MTPGLALALSLALLAGKHWQLAVESIACEGSQVTIATRIRYLGPQGAAEAPLGRIVDAKGRRYPAKSLAWRGGRCRAAADLEARKRPRAARPADFRIYRAHYPCRGAGGKLRVVEAGYPPYLPRRLLFFGHGFLPSTREVELPMGAAPAQSYAYAGADSLDAVDEAARRAVAADFPRDNARLAAAKDFAFNWGVQRSQSGNEAYSIGIYELRGC